MLSVHFNGDYPNGTLQAVPWTALRGEGGEVTSDSVLEQPKKKKGRERGGEKK